MIVRGRGATGKEPAFVELREGDKVYRGAYQPAAVSPLELAGEWMVTVDASTVLLPYAEVKDDPRDDGLRERWFERDLAGTRWSRLWLSSMLSEPISVKRVLCLKKAELRRQILIIQGFLVYGNRAESRKEKVARAVAASDSGVHRRAP